MGENDIKRGHRYSNLQPAPANVLGAGARRVCPAGIFYLMTPRRSSRALLFLGRRLGIQWRWSGEEDMRKNWADL